MSGHRQNKPDHNRGSIPFAQSFVSLRNERIRTNTRCLGPRIENTLARYRQPNDELPPKYEILDIIYKEYCAAHPDRTTEMTKAEEAELIKKCEEEVHPYGKGHRHRGLYIRGFGYSDLMEPTPRQLPVSASQIALNLARVQEELQHERAIRLQSEARAQEIRDLEQRRAEQALLLGQQRAEQARIRKAEGRRRRKIKMSQREDQLIAHLADPLNTPRPPPLSSSNSD